MLNFLYNKLGEQSDVAVIIISVAIMFICGFLMTRITKKLRLPNVTAYIVVGILIGPFCLDLIPKTIVEGTGFLPDIALAFIAFSTGEFFKLSKLKSNVGKVVIITLAEGLLASVLVFVLCYWVLNLGVAFSIVLAALASATSPASTLMTIRQTRSKGDFVDTVLQVVACDNILALLAYSIAISVALSVTTGQSFGFLNVIIPTVKNLGVMLLGGLFGYLMKLFIHRRRSNDNRLIISIALLFSFCGICAVVDVSPLLGCMSMGTVYINLTDDDKLFKQLNYFSPPILLLFFVRSGLSFDLSALLNPSGVIGGVSLLLVGLFYFGARLVGKYCGAFLGCLFVRKQPRTRNYLGMALIPQAGVAIGLAALGARSIGGEIGNAFQTIILASSILYELIGPACAKLSLYLSGSYSNKLEDIVPLDKSNQTNEINTVEELIQRIQIIQEELANEKISEEEVAFTEAAEEFESEDIRHAHFVSGGNRK